MFTSALPDEGKTDISFAAAHALSQIGKRVLLVDADIR
jgi:Mrp family chromosome partitioning ATPase